MRFLAPADLRTLDGRALEGLLERTDALVVAAAGEVSGIAAAALFFADYAVLDDGGTVVIERSEAWAGVAWRLGHRALRMHVDGTTRLGADAAREAGLVDEIFRGSAEAWMGRWMSNRSADSLDAAAALIRLRGGDMLERASFARLFAAGVPQEGLGAFLEKRRPGF